MYIHTYNYIILLRGVDMPCRRRRGVDGHCGDARIQTYSGFTNQQRERERERGGESLYFLGIQFVEGNSTPQSQESAQVKPSEIQILSSRTGRAPLRSPSLRAT